MNTKGNVRKTKTAAEAGDGPKSKTLRPIRALLAIVCIVWVAMAQTVTYYATYKLDGGTATLSNQTYNASAADTSGVWVTDSGVLTLNNPTITTSGNTSSQDNSSFYGLNAGLLATAAGKVTVRNRK